MQCVIDTPEGSPASSILSMISIPVSADKSTNAHRSLASFLAIDILRNREVYVCMCVCGVRVCLLNEGHQT